LAAIIVLVAETVSNETGADLDGSKNSAIWRIFEIIEMGDKFELPRVVADNMVSGS
jgi:hypothetical protein